MADPCGSRGGGVIFIFLLVSLKIPTGLPFRVYPEPPFEEFLDPPQRVFFGQFENWTLNPPRKIPGSALHIYKDRLTIFKLYKGFVNLAAFLLEGEVGPC